MNISLSGLNVANTEYDGNYKITGIVTVNSLPASRKVRLFEFPSLKLIDATFSNPDTGRYTFKNLPQRPSGGATYGVMCLDNQDVYDPECQVGLNAVEM